MSELQKRVLDCLLEIPYGRVVTYGQIAARLGNPQLARVVGNLLHANPAPDVYPCYKVVNAQGRLSPNFAFGGIEGQKRRLEAEGICVSGDRVELAVYGIQAPFEDTV